MKAVRQPAGAAAAPQIIWQTFIPWLTIAAVIVALAEGLLIGAAYVIAGVPNAILFTILTIAFAMLPFGAWAAFSAAAATLVVSGGSPGAAILVFAWGAIVMLAGYHFALLQQNLQ